MISNENFTEVLAVKERMSEVKKKKKKKKKNSFLLVH